MATILIYFYIFVQVLLGHVLPDKGSMGSLSKGVMYTIRKAVVNNAKSLQIALDSTTH